MGEENIRLLCTIIGIAVVSIFLGIYSFKTTPDLSNNSPIDNTPQIWTTYTNIRQGFRVEYPKNYIIQERNIIHKYNNIPLMLSFIDDSNQDGTYTCGEKRFYIEITTDESRALNFNIPDGPGWHHPDETDFTISGIQPIHTESKGPEHCLNDSSTKETPPSKRTVFLKNNLYYKIFVWSNEENLDNEFKRVVESFTFLW